MAVSFGGRPGRAPTLTHAVRQADEDRIGDPLCDRVQADCLVPLEEFPEQRDAPPTCPVCRRRDPRHRPGPSAREGPTDG